MGATGARILVVEDEALVRTLVEATLKMVGYDLVVAVDGVDALAAVDGRRDSIGLVVTDVVMPRLGGRLLVDELRRTNPALPALYLCGYPELPVDPGPHEVLEKPFSIDELLAAASRLLKR